MASSGGSSPSLKTPESKRFEPVIADKQLSNQNSQAATILHSERLGCAGDVRIFSAACNSRFSISTADLMLSALESSSFKAEIIDVMSDSLD
jgi:hypothetical protein